MTKTPDPAQSARFEMAAMSDKYLLVYRWLAGARAVRHEARARELRSLEEFLVGVVAERERMWQDREAEVVDIADDGPYRVL